jgi:hypothetical protein
VYAKPKTDLPERLTSLVEPGRDNNLVWHQSRAPPLTTDPIEMVKDCSANPLRDTPDW